MIDEKATREKLDGVPEGAVVFVSYLAGRPPTERAVREAQRAHKMGLNRRHFFGKLESCRTTRKGEFVFTVLCDHRDDERRGTEDGYRTINPSLGTLLSLEVIQ